MMKPTTADANKGLFCFVILSFRGFFFVCLYVCLKLKRISTIGRLAYFPAPPKLVTADK